MKGKWLPKRYVVQAAPSEPIEIKMNVLRHVLQHWFLFKDIYGDLAEERMT
jgi:hypothetical protein